MSNISITIDTVTKDYIPLNGQIQNSNQLEAQIYQLIQTPKTKWLYAPDSNYGSDFYTLLNQRQRLSKSQILQLVTSALDPLTSTGELTLTSLTVPVLTLGTVNIDIEGVDSSGEKVKFTINPLI